MKGRILFILILVLGLAAIFTYDYFRFFDGRLHVVFCSVGQGDAILLRTPKGKAILIDSGPNEKVVACLERHLPFWKRNIDLFVLSHPHADHYLGIYYVIDRYVIRQFATEKLMNKQNTFQKALKKLEEKAQAQYLYQGDEFKTSDGVVLSVLSPDQEFLNKTSQDGFITESGEFASLILHLKFGSFDSIFTGDTQEPQLYEALGSLRAQEIEVLQVPHHGSRTGLSERIFDIISPKLSVISVGKNRYGHPNKQILNLLRAKGIEYRETIRNGDVEVITNGKTFKVK